MAHRCDTSDAIKRPGRWPSPFSADLFPGRWPGLGNRPGRCPWMISQINRFPSSIGYGAWACTFCALAMRAEGPAVYLAQPHGLGRLPPPPTEGQRPGHLRTPGDDRHRQTVTSLATVRNGASVRHQRRHQTAGPLALTFFRRPCPRPLAWARQSTGALPLGHVTNLSCHWFAGQGLTNRAV